MRHPAAHAVLSGGEYTQQWSVPRYVLPSGPESVTREEQIREAA